MTVQDVFDIAIRLMDEQNESTGNTATADTKEYAVRACSLLNSRIDEVYSLSSTYSPEAGKPCEYPGMLSAMTDEIKMDTRLVRGVLPYLLAALLLEGEAPDQAAYFDRQYQQKMNNISGAPGMFSSIVDVYGGIGGGEFGKW